MIQYDFSNYIEMLLHCVHADNDIGADNALLQYCGLRILEQAAENNLSPQGFNTACWSIRERMEQPAIRLIKGDPINDPRGRIPGIHSVLGLPNTTTLASSSILVNQAQSRFLSMVEPSLSKLGSVVHRDVAVNGNYDALWHLVCRKPGDPSVRLLTCCFEELAPFGAPTFLHLPIFGKEEEAEQWVHGISTWLACRENIQRAAVFLDMYFIDESKRVASRIANLLDDIGVRYAWVSDERI